MLYWKQIKFPQRLPLLNPPQLEWRITKCLSLEPKWFDKYSVLFLLSKLSLQLSTCLFLKQLLSRREQGTFSKEPTQKHSFRNRVSKRIEPLYPEEGHILDQENNCNYITFTAIKANRTPFCKQKKLYY